MSFRGTWEGVNSEKMGTDGSMKGGRWNLKELGGGGGGKTRWIGFGKENSRKERKIFMRQIDFRGER